MNTNKELRDILVVGFAMFAIYFGAGNLIFPPFIGATSGTDWVMGLIGLTLTGIILPLLAVIAVANAGGTFAELSRPISPWFYKVYSALIMIGVGALISIPRTGAVAYETGVRVLLPGIPEDILKVVSLVVYFGLTYYFANDKSKVIDKVGKILTPGLLVILFGIVTLAVLKPVGLPVDTGLATPFYSAFTMAYQTGDVLTGLLCAVIFIEAFKAKGYTDNKSNLKMVAGACLVAFIGLFVVYGGLEYLGATGNSLFAPDTDKTVLLVGLVKALSGAVGTYALAVAVALACLTTAVGLTVPLADFIEDVTKGKISYRNTVIAVCVLAVFQAMGGVEKIIMIAGPIFMGIYPVSILFVILGLFKKFIPNDGVWKGSALLVILVSLYDSFSIIGMIAGFEMPAGLTAMYQSIPLAGEGFAWIIPAIVGAVIGGFLDNASKKRNSVAA